MKRRQRSMPQIHEWKSDEYSNRNQHGNAACIVEPFADTESNACQQHLCRNQHDGRCQHRPLVIRHPPQRRHRIREKC